MRRHDECTPARRPANAAMRTGRLTAALQRYASGESHGRAERRTPPTAAVDTTPTPTNPSRPRWVGPAIAVGLAMGAAAIAALVLTGMQDKAIYSKPVDELLAQKAKFVGRPVRAEGMLVHGSLVEARSAVRVPVRHREERRRAPGSLRPVRRARHVPRRSRHRRRASPSRASSRPTSPSWRRACSRSARASTRCSRGRRTASTMPHGPLASGR